MIIVRNNIIPFKGFKLMTLWPFIFIRKKARIDEIELNHENIHGMQQIEMLWIFFYLWYGIEFLIRLWFCKGSAYKNMSFEKEAYLNQEDLMYLEKRKLWEWWKYLDN